MSEQILRDNLAEKERLRDRVEDANRFGRGESALAVLRTQFEAALVHLREMMERSVSGADLKQLKREVEEDVNKQLVTVTDQQSKDILHEVRLMLATQQMAVSEEQKRTRQEIIRYGVGFALTILAALTIFWLTGR